MVEAGGKGMGGGGGAIIGGKGVAEGPAASPTNRIAGIVDVDHASRRHVWLAVAYAVAVVTRDAGHATLTLPSTDRSPPPRHLRIRDPARGMAGECPSLGEVQCKDTHLADRPSVIHIGPFVRVTASVVHDTAPAAVMQNWPAALE